MNKVFVRHSVAISLSRNESKTPERSSSPLLKTNKGEMKNPKRRKSNVCLILE